MENIMWSPYKNKITDKMRIAAKTIHDEGGIITSRMYGNLAHIANNLELHLIDDNMRLLQMGLLAQEIERRKLDGSIAELGVYRGDFSHYISRAFSDRKYYLFDTFNGFDENQINYDNEKFSARRDDFKNTSVDHVLSQISNNHSNEIIIKKGFFPNTALNINDKFVFVSIDVDLYEPTLDGLNFFYPKMVPGGYIMIHDLMANGFKGCRQAVYEFCESQNIFFTPLTDAITSALIVKT
jgi:O-methyltransferase